MAQYTLTGEEKEISVVGIYASIKNNSDNTMYAAASSGIDVASESVTPIQAGESTVIAANNDKKVYVMGTGNIAVLSGNEKFNFFKPAPKGSGGGGEAITEQQLSDALKPYATTVSVNNKLEDYATTESINNELDKKADKTEIPNSLPANGGNADTVGGKTADTLMQSNPNLIDNPDFKINQRGKSGTITDTGYFVDRWKLTSGSVTVNSDKSLTLNGTIVQILENAVGIDVTVSSNAGAISYNNSNKTVTLTASGETITWTKLEMGNIATPFVPPNPATERLMCQRYYVKFSQYSIFPHYGNDIIITLPASMASIPAILNRECFPGSTIVVAWYSGQNQLLTRFDPPLSETGSIMVGTTPLELSAEL